MLANSVYFKPLLNISLEISYFSVQNIIIVNTYFPVQQNGHSFSVYQKILIFWSTGILGNQRPDSKKTRDQKNCKSSHRRATS